MKSEIFNNVDYLLHSLEEDHTEHYLGEIKIRREPYVSRDAEIFYIKSGKAVIVIGDNLIEELSCLFFSAGFEELLLLSETPKEIVRNFKFDCLLSAICDAAFHETAHARRGHLLYRKQQAGKLDDNTLLKLEVDADAMAAGWFQPVIFRKKINKTSFYYWWISSVIGISTLFTRWSMMDRNNDGYPHIAIRNFYFTQRLFALWKKKNSRIPQ
jgi:hypothetical protein